MGLPLSLSVPPFSQPGRFSLLSGRIHFLLGGQFHLPGMPPTPPLDMPKHKGPEDKPLPSLPAMAEVGCPPQECNLHLYKCSFQSFSCVLCKQLRATLEEPGLSLGLFLVPDRPKGWGRCALKGSSGSQRQPQELWGLRSTFSSSQGLGGRQCPGKGPSPFGSREVSGSVRMNWIIEKLKRLFCPSLCWVTLKRSGLGLLKSSLPKATMLLSQEPAGTSLDSRFQKDK